MEADKSHPGHIRMNLESQKELIADFLGSQRLGVVATLDKSSGHPEAAVVAYSGTENLELIFGAFLDSRKVLNLEKDPRTAFVVWDKNITVQYEGIASVAKGKESDRLRAIHLEKEKRLGLKGSDEYAFHEKQRYIKIAPPWARYSDFASTPETIFEIKFEN
jgi:hypothetical protein